MIYPFILCGGVGAGLWPSSRAALPKQFTNLIGARTLFQDTVARVSGPDFTAPVVLTHADYGYFAREQASEIGLTDVEIVLEPVRRGTGPAILTAALRLLDKPDALILVLPADQLIRDSEAFISTIRSARGAAEDGALVAFGVVPGHPGSSGDGMALATPAVPGQPAQLERFHARASQHDAVEAPSGGGRLLSTGIFLFRAGALIDSVKAHSPHLLPACQASLAAAKSELGFLRLGASGQAGEPPLSIEDAVMTRAGNVSAVSLDAGWSDLGSWEAMLRATAADAEGVAQSGRVTAIDCRNTLLRSEEDSVHLVGFGLRNIAAVAMRDAILIADLDRADEVPQVVAELGRRGHAQAVDYPRFHRPWGWYETLCLGERFQVKRIMVKPGGLLSLQSHVHRAEHWVVVAGTARVTVGEDVRLLSENQSIYIPLGAVHRMENPGKVPMYLIEVQAGSYLGEDDIVRYEDIYNRA